MTQHFILSAARGEVPRTATELGVPLPDAVQTAVARAAEMPSMSIAAPRGDAIAEAIVAAVDAKRDPGTDPEVLRLAALQSLSTVSLEDALRRYADDQLAAAFVEHADEIIAGWRERVAAEATALVEAHQQLGDVDLDESARLLRGPTVGAWATAKTGNEQIVAAVRGWQTLMGVAGVAPDARRALLRICAPSLDQWRTLDPKSSPWQLVCAGLDLDLADRQTYRKRVAALDAAIEREAAAQADAERNALRSLSSGAGVRPPAA